MVWGIFGRAEDDDRAICMVGENENGIGAGAAQGLAVMLQDDGFMDGVSPRLENHFAAVVLFGERDHDIFIRGIGGNGDDRCNAGGMAGGAKARQTNSEHPEQRAKSTAPRYTTRFVVNGVHTLLTQRRDETFKIITAIFD